MLGVVRTVWPRMAGREPRAAFCLCASVAILDLTLILLRTPAPGQVLQSTL